MLCSLYINGGHYNQFLKIGGKKSDFEKREIKLPIPID
jgi:hypothetical protein